LKKSTGAATDQNRARSVSRFLSLTQFIFLLDHYRAAASAREEKKRN
jgi:hypothetical protein